MKDIDMKMGIKGLRTQLEQFVTLHVAGCSVALYASPVVRTRAAFFFTKKTKGARGCDSGKIPVHPIVC